MPTNTMLPGDKLNPNERLWSSNNKYFMMYQAEDGNLVIYDNSAKPPNPIWNSRSAGKNPMLAELDTGGNFVIWDAGGDKNFETGTYQPTRRGTSLVLQDDGNLVLYGITPLWTSLSDPDAKGAAGSASPLAAGGFNLQNVAAVVQDVTTVVQIAVEILF